MPKFVFWVRLANLSVRRQLSVIICQWGQLSVGTSVSGDSVYDVVSDLMHNAVAMC